MTFETMTQDRRDIIEREAVKLQEQINDRLKDFRPSMIKFGRARSLGTNTGLDEAQAIADLMAGGIYEVQVRETIGAAPNYRAFVTMYLGGRP